MPGLVPGIFIACRIATFDADVSYTSAKNIKKTCAFGCRMGNAGVCHRARSIPYIR